MSASGVFSELAYRWEGALVIGFDHEGVLTVVVDDPRPEALVTGASGDTTRFTGDIVGRLFVEAFRWAALGRLAARALPDTPVPDDPIRVGPPADSQEAWLRAVRR